MRGVIFPLIAGLIGISIIVHAGESTARHSLAAYADHASAALLLEQAVQLTEQGNLEQHRALEQRAAIGADTADARGLLWNNLELLGRRVAAGDPSLLDARERIDVVSVSLPSPLFQRNGSGVGRAAIELSRAQVARQPAGRDANLSVGAPRQRLHNLTATMAAFQQAVLSGLRLARITVRAFQ